MDEFGDLLGILPEDVLMEILIRLPVRNLLCLRCVCKSFCTLIDHDYNFIHRHYQFQYASTGDIPSMCYGPHFDIWNYSFRVSLLSIQNGVVPVELYHDFIRDAAPSFTTAPDDWIKKGRLVGGVKGVACILWGYRDFGLWNPATREFKPVTPWLYRPFVGGDVVLVGFGFDSASNDFKIVRGTRPPGFTADKWLTVTYEVYSLATNSWKSVTGPSPFVRGCVNSLKITYFNGFGYWVVYDADVDHRPAKMSILSFNFSTNAFTVFEGPQNVYHPQAVITLYKESLAIVVEDEEDEEHSFHTWVVTEFDDDCPGIAKSWQHILTMGPFTLSDGLWFDGFRMDGEVLFLGWCGTSEEENRFYNPSTGTFRNLGCVIVIVFNYVESLFPLSKRLIM